MPLTPRYWWRNVREPVNFEAAIRAMIDAGINTFVEIGPRAVLTSYLTRDRQTLGCRGVRAAEPDAQGGRRRALERAASRTRALRRRCAIGRACFRCPDAAWICRTIHGSASGTGIRPRRNRRDSSRARSCIRCSAMRWRARRCIGKITWTSPSCRSMPITWSAAAPCCRPRDSSRWRSPPDCERRRLEQRAPNAPLVIEDLEIVAPLLLESERSRTVRLRVDAGDGRFTIVSRERLARRSVAHPRDRTAGRGLPRDQRRRRCGLPHAAAPM